MKDRSNDDQFLTLSFVRVVRRRKQLAALLKRYERSRKKTTWIKKNSIYRPFFPPVFRQGSSRKVLIENKLKHESNPGYSFAK